MNEFYFFMLPVALARHFSMLNKSVPDIGGKVFSLLQLYIFAVSLSWMAFIMLKFVPSILIFLCIVIFYSCLLIYIPKLNVIYILPLQYSSILYLLIY